MHSDVNGGLNVMAREAVTIPKELLRELVLELSKVEEVLATLEELLDEKSLRRIREAEEEYRKLRRLRGYLKRGI
jgi:hypothetical protein